MLHSILKFMFKIISVSHKEGAMNSGTVSDKKNLKLEVIQILYLLQILVWMNCNQESSDKECGAK